MDGYGEGKSWLQWSTKLAMKRHSRDKRKGDDDMDDGQEGNIRDPIVQRNSNIKFFS